MPRPLFTVIVPTHGRSTLLAQAVASVLTQTVADLECVVVDDASPEPPEVPVDPRLRLVRRILNGGPAAARNTGLEQARGRFIAFLDDDDLYEPDRLAIALEGHARAPVVVCWDEGDQSVRDGDVSDTILDSVAPHLGRTTVARHAAIPFDERFICSEDNEWWLRLASKASVATVPKIGFRWRRHDGPRHQLGLAERVRGNLLLLEVHRAYFESHPRAAAFRWKRIGLLAERAGDRALARQAFGRSLSLEPRGRTAWHLARSLRPSTDHLEPP